MTEILAMAVAAMVIRFIILAVNNDKDTKNSERRKNNDRIQQFLENHSVQINRLSQALQVIYFIIIITILFEVNSSVMGIIIFLTLSSILVFNHLIRWILMTKTLPVYINFIFIACLVLTNLYTYETYTHDFYDMRTIFDFMLFTSPLFYIFTTATENLKNQNTKVNFLKRPMSFKYLYIALGCICLFFTYVSLMQKLYYEPIRHKALVERLDKEMKKREHAQRWLDSIPNK